MFYTIESNENFPEGKHEWLPLKNHGNGPGEMLIDQLWEAGIQCEELLRDRTIVFRTMREARKALNYFNEYYGEAFDHRIAKA